jgi:3'(2'), 5'-bisphosphate nucleotidase
MINLDQPEVQFAIHATRRAALLVRQVQRELVLPALAKEDRSPVTVADFTVQALVAGLLERAFPGDALVGEETADALRQPEGSEMLAQVTAYVRQELPGATPEQVCDWIDRGQGQPGIRYWVLDPVDGTKGFLRGGQYAVALALLENHQVQLGLLGCPNLAGGWKEAHDGAGTLAVAQRGGGTWISSLDGETTAAAMSFSERRSRRKPTCGRYALLRSLRGLHTNTGILDRLAEQRTSPPPYGWTARPVQHPGCRAERSDPACPPDDQPGSEKRSGILLLALVLEEAGGQASDLDGKPLTSARGAS